MKKNLLLFLILISTVSLFSQEKLKGNKVVTTQNREVEPFTKVVVKDDFKVFIESGTKAAVTVTTDENLHEAVATRVSEGTLEIYFAQKIASSKELIVKVTLPEQGLTTLESRDKSKIISEIEIKADSLHIVALDNSAHKYAINAKKVTLELDNDSKSEFTINAKKTIINAEQNADVKIQIKSDLLLPNLYNSTKLKISGICKELELITQDDTKYYGKECIADQATLNASDKSDVEINASKSIYIDTENDAKIYLFNQPKITLNSFKDKAILFKK